MKETELERLVVRLTGDAAQYTKMLTEAQKKTQQTAKEVEKAASRIEKIQHGLEKFGATAGGVFASVGIVASLKKAYEKFDEASDTIDELSAVIQANGNIVGEVLPKYEKFAKEMAKVTTSSKGATMALFQQAEALGVSGDKAEKAIKNAITLGAMKNTDPSSFLRQTVNFEKTGNASGIARVIGLIGEMEEGTDKAAEVTKLLANNWALVEVKGADGSAKIARAQAAMGGIVKDVGAIVASVVEPLIDKVGKLADWFTSLNPTIRAVIVSAVLLVAAIEPLIVAYTFLAARIAVVKAAFIASMGVMEATAMKAWALSLAYDKMSASAKIATLSVGALTVVVAVAAVAAYLALRSAIAEMNKELERSDKLNDKIVAREKKKTQPITEQLDKIKSAGERKAYADQFLPEAEGRLHDLERQLERAKKETAEKDVQTRDMGPIRVGKGMPGFGAGLQAEYEAAEKAQSGVQKLLDQQKEYVEALRSAPKISAEAIKSVEDLTQKYRDQTETAGMTAEQIEMYNAKKMVGDDHYLIAMLRENQEMAEQAKKHADATNDIKSFNEAMQLQIATFGMSAEQAKLYKAQLAGVDQSLLDQSQRLMDAADSQKYFQKMFEDGAALMRKHMTPLEQYDEQVAQLMELWEGGAIDLATFHAEMDEITGRYEELTTVAQEATAAIGENNAVKSGGAAAKGAIFSYSQSLSAQQNSQTKPVTDRLDKSNVLLGKIAEGVDFAEADL